MEDLVYEDEEMKEKVESIMLRRLKLLYGIDINDMDIINISVAETSDEPSVRIVLIDSSHEEECVRVFEIV